MSERIVAAACRQNGRTFHLMPPARHHDVIRMMWFDGIGIPGSEQGFVTDAERFVDRKEAVKIAKAAGQITEPKWPPNLYSEDLW